MTGALLEVRDPSLARRGQIKPLDLAGASFISRRRAVGAWSIQLPEGNAACDLLRQPGWGIIVTLDNGEVFLSGPLTQAEFAQSEGDPGGTWTLSGYDDNRILADYLAWPTPTSSDVTAQPGTASSGYDQRSGPAETVMRGYVLANAGASSPADRRVPLLDVAATQGRGGTVAGSARFDLLTDLLDALAKVGGDLGWRVRQNGARLLFEVTQPRDLTRLVRFDVTLGTAESVTYSYAAPTATREIVGGAGNNAARTLVPRWTAASLAAETAWGRRVEQFLDDQGDTTVSALQQAGDQALADAGKTKVSLAVTPADTPDVQYGRDYRLGDTVTVVVGGIEIADVISETTLTYDTSGVTVKATVGDASAALTDPLLKALNATRDQARRLGRLERR